jgi:hypothetical protein
MKGAWKLLAADPEFSAIIGFDRTEGWKLLVLNSQPLLD